MMPPSAVRKPARANVRNAQIELGYATISSPIDGVIGISNFEIGDLVGTIGSLYLNTVSSTRHTAGAIFYQ